MCCSERPSLLHRVALLFLHSCSLLVTSAPEGANKNKTYVAKGRFAREARVSCVSGVVAKRTGVEE